MKWWLLIVIVSCSSLIVAQNSGILYAEYWNPYDNDVGGYASINNIVVKTVTYQMAAFDSSGSLTSLNTSLSLGDVRIRDNDTIHYSCILSGDIPSDGEYLILSFQVRNQTMTYRSADGSTVSFREYAELPEVLCSLSTIISSEFTDEELVIDGSKDMLGVILLSVIILVVMGVMVLFWFSRKKSDDVGSVREYASVLVKQN